MGRGKREKGKERRGPKDQRRPVRLPKSSCSTYYVVPLQFCALYIVPKAMEYVHDIWGDGSVVGFVEHA